MKALSGAGGAVLSALAISGMAYAADVASVPAPALKVGDSWTYQETRQQGQTGFSQTRLQLSVERLNSDSMIVAVKAPDAPTAPQEQIVGLDWSQRLVVDGEQKTTQRPLSFPLKVGNSWTADWTDPRRQGNQISGHTRSTYKVVGWEDVTVPAGTFHALKIEINGVADADVVVPLVAQSTAVGAPGAGAATTRVQQGGRGKLHFTLYTVIYYAPEVKRAVKTIDEQYNSSEVMVVRTTEEMVAYKLVG